MTVITLDGCQAKLDRAHEHLKTLVAEERAYFQTKPHRTDKRYDSESGVFSFVGRVLESPSLRFGVILGDLVHNLRSALDHLVWQLVLANGKEPGISNEFPVCVQEDKWQKLVKTDLKGVAERDVDAIRTLQPFVTRPLRPEDSPLARLHRLWNRDKHQVVTPVVVSLASPLPDIRVGVSPIGPDSGLELIPRRDVGEILEARQYWGVLLHLHPIVEARITATGPSPDIDLRGRAMAGLAFEENVAVNEAINDMATEVERIVNLFGNRMARALTS